MSSKRIDQLSQQITLADLIADHRLLVQNTDTGEAAGVSGIEALSQLGEHALGSWAFREDVTNIILPNGATSYQLTNEEERASFLVFSGTPADGCEILFNNERAGPWTALSVTQNESTLVLKGESADEGVELLSSFQSFLDPSIPYRLISVLNVSDSNRVVNQFAEGAYNDVQQSGTGLLLREDGDASELTNLPIKHEGFVCTNPASTPDEGLILLDKQGSLVNKINLDGVTQRETVKVSPDGTMVAVGRSIGGSSALAFTVVSLITGEILLHNPADGEGNVTNGLAWSPDSSELYIMPAAGGTTVYIYDATDWSAAPSTFTAETGGGPHPIDVSADNTRIVIGGNDGAFLFRVSDKEQLAQLTTNSCIAAKISRDSSQVAVGRFSGGGNLQIFETSGSYSQISAAIPAIGTQPQDLAWSPGDDYLVASHSDGADNNNSLTLFKTDSSEWTTEDDLPPSAGQGRQVAFTDDGLHIYQTYQHGVRLISMATGKQIFDFFTPDGSSWSVYGQPTPRDAVALSTVAWRSAGDQTPLTQSDAQSGTSLLAREEGEASAMTGIPRAVPVERTASHTLVAGDAGRLQQMNVGSANDLTVPPASSVEFPVGTQIPGTQLGAGTTTIVAGSGVTIRNLNGLVSQGQDARWLLEYEGSDTWLASGDLTT